MLEHVQAFENPKSILFYIKNSQSIDLESKIPTGKTLEHSDMSNTWAFWELEPKWL